MNVADLNKEKKDTHTQHESCELSFNWGKMRTSVWEAAPQRAQRNCSKEVGGSSVYMSFW